MTGLLQGEPTHPQVQRNSLWVGQDPRENAPDRVPLDLPRRPAVQAPQAGEEHCADELNFIDRHSVGGASVLLKTSFFGNLPEIALPRGGQISVIMAAALEPL